MESLSLPYTNSFLTVTPKASKMPVRIAQLTNVTIRKIRGGPNSFLNLSRDETA